MATFRRAANATFDWCRPKASPSAPGLLNRATHLSLFIPSDPWLTRQNHGYFQGRSGDVPT
jgi:hypothetical protein